MKVKAIFLDGTEKKFSIPAPNGDCDHNIYTAKPGSYKKVKLVFERFDRSSSPGTAIYKEWKDTIEKPEDIRKVMAAIESSLYTLTHDDGIAWSTR